MSIKTMIIRTTTRVERLVQSIFGVSVASVPPARASLAEPPSARSGKPMTNSIKANVESPQTPSAKRRSKPTSSKGEVLPLEQRRWLTVKETSARFSGWRYIGPRSSRGRSPSGTGSWRGIQWDRGQAVPEYQALVIRK